MRPGKQFLGVESFNFTVFSCLQILEPETRGTIRSEGKGKTRTSEVR